MQSNAHTPLLNSLEMEGISSQKDSATAQLQVLLMGWVTACCFKCVTSCF